MHRIRLLELPELLVGGDIVDFVAGLNGKPIADIRDVIDNLVDDTAVDYAGTSSSSATHSSSVIGASAQGVTNAISSSAPPLPAIMTHDRGLAEVSDEGIEALCARNTPPHLFSHCNRMARLRQMPNGIPAIEALSLDALRGELARSATWLTIDKTAGRIRTFPPMEVARDLASRPDCPLPVLHGVVGAPYFAPGGGLLVTPGYHPETGLWYQSQHPLLPQIPSTPTEAEKNAAREFLCTELFGDFVFVDDLSRATAFAALILPFVRAMISGPTPLHAFDSPTPGTGKGLIVNVVSRVNCAIPRVTPAGRNDEEWRKTITAALLAGVSPIVFDNISEPLASPAFAAALTALDWSDRELGHTRMLNLPVRAVWMVTGNNLAFSREMQRRTVICRINAGIEQPELRAGFRHPNLLEWIDENLAQLITAVLTLVQYWIAADQPPGPSVLGSFENWSRVVGGILELAGVKGLLDDANKAISRDDESAELKAFIRVWIERFGNQQVTAKQLMDGVVGPELLQLPSLLATVPSEHGRRVKLGQFLKSNRDKVFGAHRLIIASTDNHGVQRFQLIPFGPDRAEIGNEIGGDNSPSAKSLHVSADSADSGRIHSRVPEETECTIAAPTYGVPVAGESARSAGTPQTPRPQQVTSADSTADSSPIPRPELPNIGKHAADSGGSAPSIGNREEW